MTYTLRELQRAEAKQVYDEQMQRDFPPDELKSCSDGCRGLLKDRFRSWLA